MEVPLDEVPPQPHLAAARPAPAGPPPVEALQNFAQARIAILDNERYTAINLLEDAIKSDPNSFELYDQLGRLYQGNASSDPQSIAAFEKAAAIDPDHLDLQINLGRQYLAEGDSANGIKHLLLALQTSEYLHDGPAAAEAELFLSNALDQQGYDRAALTLLHRLAARLANPGMAMRENPAVTLLLEHPEDVVMRIGVLQQKRGHYADALDAYQALAERDPSNIDVQERIVAVLSAMGRSQDASRRAAELIVHTEARPSSIALLRESLRNDGGDEAASNVLAQLYQQHPSMRQLLLARLDLLRTMGRSDEAQRTLTEAAAAHPDDQELATRQFQAVVARGDRLAAAADLIQITTRHPDWTPEFEPLFDQLLAPTTRGRIKIQDLRSLSAAGSAEPVKLFWIARYAATWHRDGIAHQAIDQAVQCSAVFPPAYRERLAYIWMEMDGDPAVGAAASALAERAAASNPALAMEIRGLILLHLQQPAEAATMLAGALKNNRADAELALEQAEATREAGDDAGFESAMWKLLSDHPAYDEGYLEFYDYYTEHESAGMGEKVLATWLSADPDSVAALRLEARDDFQSNRSDAAESILTRLFAEHDDDGEVLGTLEAFYLQTNRPEGLPQKLEDLLKREPYNLAAVSVLSDLYFEQHHPGDAARVIDLARQACSGDADMLYSLSGLMARDEQKLGAEQILREVLRLEPDYPAASNDLGYFLTEEGRNMAEAEVLIRAAVTAEPFNTSFLDSMGWVLYKRGRFAEARKFLERAASPASDADPIVLNHLGDDEYRLGERDAAAQSWKQAGQRIAVTGEEREDLKGLTQQLIQKRQQLDAGQPVDVAPVIEPAAPIGPQAEN